MFLFEKVIFFVLIFINVYYFNEMEKICLCFDLLFMFDNYCVIIIFEIKFSSVCMIIIFSILLRSL